MAKRTKRRKGPRTEFYLPFYRNSEGKWDYLTFGGLPHFYKTMLGARRAVMYGRQDEEIKIGIFNPQEMDFISNSFQTMFERAESLAVLWMTKAKERQDLVR